MNIPSSLIIGAALALGPLVALAFIAVGIFGYTPEKMQTIRQGEAEDQDSPVVEEVRAIVIGRPERFRHDRLDRHYTYLGLHVGAWCYAWCVFAGAPVTSNVQAIGKTQLFLMAACFLVGSSMALTGALMGAHIGRFAFLRGISDNVTSARLSDDIRMPYTFGAVGMACMISSCGIYASTSFDSTTGSLGGWLTLCAGAVASVCLLFEFIRRIRIYVFASKRIINNAVANIVKRGGSYDDY